MSNTRQQTETSADAQASSNAVEQKPFRLSVNMNPETADALREIAKAHGISITEAVRRAVSVAHFVEQQSREGKSVQIEDPKTGKIKELLMM